VLRSRSGWFSSLMAFGAMAVLAGCTSIGPLDSAGPGASLPGEVPTGPLPTLAPGQTLAPGETAAPPTTPTKTKKPPKGTPTPTLPGETPTPTLPAESPTPTPPTNPWPAGAIAASDAASHIGETLWVCGTVEGANWLFDKKGHPTWLNFGAAYPSQNFNAVIWGEQRRDWPLAGKPEVVYPGHEICVNGVIQMYQTWPQIQDVNMSSLLPIN
jgi:hypothetical protein